MNTLDLEDYRTPTPSPSGGERKKPPRQGTPFLAGPIPWWWLNRAGGCTGRSLHVGLVLWHLAKLAGRRTVKLNLSRLAKDFGFDRTTASRALSQLSRAGLVRTLPGEGRCHIVEIVDPPPGR